MRWRPALVALHRDTGFFAVGLTLVYAVSGIAENHREHWDYNYSREQRVERVGLPAQLLGLAEGATSDSPGELARVHQAALVERLALASGRSAAPYKVFWRGPDRLSLFFDRADVDVVDYRPSLGELEHVRKSQRPLMRQFNFLHLNEGRGLWTWVADGYAAVLLFLALSGVVIVRGRKGLVGRGGVYLALGVALPVALYLWIAR